MTISCLHPLVIFSVFFIFLFYFSLSIRISLISLPLPPPLLPTSLIFTKILILGNSLEIGKSGKEWKGTGLHLFSLLSLLMLWVVDPLLILIAFVICAVVLTIFLETMLLFLLIYSLWFLFLLPLFSSFYLSLYFIPLYIYSFYSSLPFPSLPFTMIPSSLFPSLHYDSIPSSLFPSFCLYFISLCNSLFLWLPWNCSFLLTRNFFPLNLFFQSSLKFFFVSFRLHFQILKKFLNKRCYQAE